MRADSIPFGPRPSLRSRLLWGGLSALSLLFAFAAGFVTLYGLMRSLGGGLSGASSIPTGLVSIAAGALGLWALERALLGRPAGLPRALRFAAILGVPAVVLTVFTVHQFSLAPPR